MSCRILICDDNDDDVYFLLHALKSADLSVDSTRARDGEEALDFLLCRGRFSQRSPLNPPKLVLLDLKLPKLGGLEVLRAIRADPRTRHIPVVILTSSQQDRDVADGLDDPRREMREEVVDPRRVELKDAHFG